MLSLLIILNKATISSKHDNKDSLTNKETHKQTNRMKIKVHFEIILKMHDKNSSIVSNLYVE